MEAETENIVKKQDVKFDKKRMKVALESQRMTVQNELSREEKRKLILSLA